jgi:nucleoside-diphosphate-sugar epimerase
MKALITGYPNLSARRVITEVMQQCPDSEILLFSREKHEQSAKEFLSKLPNPERARIILGDVASIDLGLSGQEIVALSKEVTHLYHLAEISYHGIERPEVKRVNVDGTQNMLSFAKECSQLERLMHYSTAFVSGDRVGVVMEDELDEGQGFRDDVEATKFQAEQLVQRASLDLPITIVRPSTVVGDSQSGEIDRLVGPYYAVVLHLLSPKELRLPVPGSGYTPLNMVPVDFVAKAIYALSTDDDALGKTYHLTDPNPLSAKRVFALVAKTTGKKPPLGKIPVRLTQFLMRTPGLEKLLRAPRQAIESFNHFAIYNCRNTVATLGPKNIHCPLFESYVEPLVAYVDKTLEDRRKKKSPEDLGSNA